MLHRLTAGLMLLCSAAGAQQADNPPTQSNVGMPVQGPGPITPMPAHPVPYTPPLVQQQASPPAPAVQPKTPPPAAPVAPAAPQPAAAAPPETAPAAANVPERRRAERRAPPADDPLAALLKERNDFDLAQIAERARFDAAPENKGFWRHWLNLRKFDAAQAKARKEFDEAYARRLKTLKGRDL